MLYHASPIGGLTVLTPHVSNHGRPLVYFSKKRENVLVYLSNAVEKYCRDTGFVHTGRWEKWGPYGFDLDGVQRLEEYYPNALEETYAGVSGYIYGAEPANTAPVSDVPFANFSFQRLLWSLARFDFAARKFPLPFIVAIAAGGGINSVFGLDGVADDSCDNANHFHENLLNYFS